MFPPVEELTHDGYDLQFGVNVLGHFYFTQLLLPVLLTTAKVSLDGKTRVVNTSSIGHELFDGIHFDTLLSSLDGLGKEEAEKARRKLGTSQLYNQSKVGNVIHARELAKRYGDQGLVATSCNPGNLWTDLQRNVQGLGRILLVRDACPRLCYVISNPPFGIDSALAMPSCAFRRTHSGLGGHLSGNKGYERQGMFFLSLSLCYSNLILNIRLA